MAYSYRGLNQAEQASARSERMTALEKDHYLLTRELAAVEKQPATHGRNVRIATLQRRIADLEAQLGEL